MVIRKIHSTFALSLLIASTVGGCNGGGDSPDGGSGTPDDGGRPAVTDGSADGRSASTDSSDGNSPATGGDGDTDGGSDGTTDDGATDDGASDGGATDAGLTLPAILLSEQHRATCLVQQGDVMPEIELADVSGQQLRLADLLGERLTVVCFWSGKIPSAVQQLQDMQPEVIDEFGDQGVAIVTVNYGQTAEEAKAVAESAGADVPILLDTDGSAMAQVATRYLPRTYLLDSDGKVIWFDLEYSRDTQRHLAQSIRYALAQP